MSSTEFIETPLRTKFLVTPLSLCALKDARLVDHKVDGIGYKLDKQKIMDLPPGVSVVSGFPISSPPDLGPTVFICGVKAAGA